MKEWQRGYDIETLKKISNVFKQEFKPFVYGAFGIPNERDIATLLLESRLIKTADFSTVAEVHQYEKKGSIKDFRGVSMDFPAGTIYIKSIAGEKKETILKYFLEKCSNRPLIVEIFDEMIQTRRIIEGLGFKYMLSKISAASDLKGVYGFNISTDDISILEKKHLEVLNNSFLEKEKVETILKELEGLDWANHYSSYNKDKSWSAVSLRGYDVDNPYFIIKPTEMSQKWKKENSEKLQWKSNWISGVERMFPETKAIILEKFGIRDFDRIRFMKLQPNDGELLRHADITDREAGIETGKVVRLHIPIKTNKDVIFKSWSERGSEKVMNMEVGGLYYLDVRKPHTAINGGQEERIHLVIDVRVDEKIKELFI